MHWQLYAVLFALCTFCTVEPSVVATCTVEVYKRYMWALKFGWVIGLAFFPLTILGYNWLHKEIQGITHCVNPAVLWTTEAPEKNKHLSRYRTFPFPYHLRVQQCRFQQRLSRTLGSTPFAEQGGSGVNTRTSRGKSPFEAYMKPRTSWTDWWTSCVNSYFDKQTTDKTATGRTSFPAKDNRGRKLTRQCGKLKSTGAYAYPWPRPTKGTDDQSCDKYCGCCRRRSSTAFTKAPCRAWPHATSSRITMPFYVNGRRRMPIRSGASSSKQQRSHESDAGPDVTFILCDVVVWGLVLPLHCGDMCHDQPRSMLDSLRTCAWKAHVGMHGPMWYRACITLPPLGTWILAFWDRTFGGLCFGDLRATFDHIAGVMESSVVRRETLELGRKVAPATTSETVVRNVSGIVSGRVCTTDIGSDCACLTFSCLFFAVCSTASGHDGLGRRTSS